MALKFPLRLRQHLDLLWKVLRALVQNVVLIAGLDWLLPAKEDFAGDVDQKSWTACGRHIHPTDHALGEAHHLTGRMIVHPDLVPCLDTHSHLVSHAAMSPLARAGAQRPTYAEVGIV